MYPFPEILLRKGQSSSIIPRLEEERERWLGKYLRKRTCTERKIHISIFSNFKTLVLFLLFKSLSLWFQLSWNKESLKTLLFWSFTFIHLDLKKIIFWKNMEPIQIYLEILFSSICNFNLLRNFIKMYLFLHKEKKIRTNNVLCIANCKKKRVKSFLKFNIK